MQQLAKILVDFFKLCVWENFLYFLVISPFLNYSRSTVCWLPFFTLYLIRPFCDDCINQLLFSVLFWLGYCNSMINPFIYATFSKDFRFAFKRVIYRCFCSKKYLEEHKFHVLHRFVPFPFAAGLAGQRNDLNLDIARWRSFTTATALNANAMRPLTEICHPIIMTNLSSNCNATSSSQSPVTALNELATSGNLFRSKSVRVANSITRL